MPQPSPAPANEAEHDFVPTVADGRFGRFAIDARGDWRYVQTPAAGRLRAGQRAVERFEVRRGDGSMATVAITVIGDAEDEWVAPLPHRQRDSALPA